MRRFSASACRPGKRRTVSAASATDTCCPPTRWTCFWSGPPAATRRVRGTSRRPRRRPTPDGPSASRRPSFRCRNRSSSTPPRRRRFAISSCRRILEATGGSAPSTSCREAGRWSATSRYTWIRAAGLGPPTRRMTDRDSLQDSKARSRSRCGGRASRSPGSTASAMPCRPGPTSSRGFSTKRPGSPRGRSSPIRPVSDFIWRRATSMRSSRRWSIRPPNRPAAS